MLSLSCLAASSSSYRVLASRGVRVSLPRHSNRSRTAQQARLQSICVSRRDRTSPHLRIYDKTSLSITIPELTLLGRRCNSIDSQRNHFTNTDALAPIDHDPYKYDRHNQEETREVRDGKHINSHGRFYSRRILKALDLNSNVAILDSIRNGSRGLYTRWDPLNGSDSYCGYQWSKKRPLSSKKVPTGRNDDDAAMEEHTSFGSFDMISILARYLHAVTTSQEDQPQPSLSTQEKYYLASKGYTAESVEQWSESILEKRSVPAASLFKNADEKLPLFLVSFYLQRKHIKAQALSIIFRHLQSRARYEDISWYSLTKLLPPLVRHARSIRPEALPWIATFFSTEATKYYADLKGKKSFSTQLPHLTKFSNLMLQLLSLPVHVKSIVNSRHQETAMFQVLQFMASCEPASTMTKRGFRAMTRNQLMRPKTAQEREWASLKGPSWPPWKENRNAMDEEKEYEFGASRASRIMHRMFEAGYQDGAWEHVAEIYAGWDTDRSPTIQSRTTFPHVSSRLTYPKKANHLLWVARIRVTRTRREAWACFLACESSGNACSAQVYLAMFEKLHASVLEEQHGSDVDHGSEDVHHSHHLSGDTPKVMPEAQSPYHHVYLREPIPSSEQLYDRMNTNNVPVNGRLLAFLIETLPNFSTILRLLEAEQSEFDGGVAVLMEGSVFSGEGLPVPGYFFTSFIEFLCRFGRLDRPPSTEPLSLPLRTEEHRLRLHSEACYRVEYAQALLMHYKPAYTPAWAAYVHAIRLNRENLAGHSQFSRQKIRAAWDIKRYRIVCNVFRILDELDVDPQDPLFRTLCRITGSVTIMAHQDLLSHEDRTHVLATAPRFVRFAFHNLVGADIDSYYVAHVRQEQTITPHIPDPETLHAYARTLGLLRDYEGLYSLSIWATTHHEQISTLAHAHTDGRTQFSRMLIALRAGLEGQLSNGPCGEPPSPELVELVRAKIEGVAGWGWPTGEQVKAYMKSAAKPFHYLRGN
ncbi:unnamed protein product [Periconia digitata]|uniref:Uncharacterized protein n=1 Tax=Periconia digitata TaxID=1303443 RepID=A0A9W4XXT0_9PLEO|nr:unnamed protein product [Periconia digitata]